MNLMELVSRLQSSRAYQSGLDIPVIIATNDDWWVPVTLATEEDTLYNTEEGLIMVIQVDF